MERNPAKNNFNFLYLLINRTNTRKNTIPKVIDRIAPLEKLYKIHQEEKSNVKIFSIEVFSLNMIKDIPLFLMS